MMKEITYRLHTRIALVAPIDGVCLGQLRIDFQPSATPEQRAAAQAILDAFDPVAAQAEIEAEEAVERDRQEWLKTVKARYIADMAEVRRHIKALEVAANIKWPSFVPEPWD